MASNDIKTQLIQAQPYIVMGGALLLIYHVLTSPAGSTKTSQGYVPYLPVAPLGADPGTFDEFVGTSPYPSTPISRPMSTHSSLGGGKGGPLVGSQMTKLGGSEFLPGRRLYQDNYGYGPGQFGSRKAASFVSPSPPSSVPVPGSLPAPQPIQPPMSAPETTPIAPPSQQLGTMFIDSRDGYIVQPRR